MDSIPVPVKSKRRSAEKPQTAPAPKKRKQKRRKPAAPTLTLQQHESDPVQTEHLLCSEPHVMDHLGRVLEQRGIRYKRRTARDVEILDSFSALIQDRLEHPVDDFKLFLHMLQKSGTNVNEDSARFERLIRLLAEDRTVLRRSASMLSLMPEDPMSVMNQPIEGVAWEYCQQFYVEPSTDPLAGERPCRRGTRGCLGVMLGLTYPDNLEHNRVKGFVLREFLVPSELKHFRETGELPLEPKLCLLCSRAKSTLNAYAPTSYGAEPNGTQCDQCKALPPDEWCSDDCRGVNRALVIQDHYNLNVGQPGQYRTAACLFPTPNGKFTGIMHPIVEYRDLHYTVTFDETLQRRVVVEHGLREPVAKLSHFRIAPAVVHSTATTTRRVA